MAHPHPASPPSPLEELQPPVPQRSCRGSLEADLRHLIFKVAYCVNNSVIKQLHRRRRNCTDSLADFSTRHRPCNLPSSLPSLLYPLYLSALRLSCHTATSSCSYLSVPWVYSSGPRLINISHLQRGITQHIIAPSYTPLIRWHLAGKTESTTLSSWAPQVLSCAPLWLQDHH